MLRNYLVVAIRNLMQQKIYTSISVLGLAVGLACCIPILLFVQDEFRYESHHTNADRIYTIVREDQQGEGSAAFLTGTPGALGTTLANEFPEVETVVRTWARSRWIQYNNREFEQIICLADASILQAFNFPLVQGYAATALADPFSILITEQTAQKIFGNEDPIGKTISVRHVQFRGEYHITGVLKDLPEQTNLRFDFLTATVSRESEPQRVWHEWLADASWHPLQTYVLLKEKQIISNLKKQMPNFIARHLGQQYSTRYQYHFQPLTRVHLYNSIDFGVTGPGDIREVSTMLLVALFILLIACINFMNLTTARAGQRSKEVGMRKVMGAQQMQLRRQFLVESLLLSLVSMILALALVEATLSNFNAFVEKSLALDILANPALAANILLVWIVVGVLAGSYPAFYLSALKPLTAAQHDNQQNTKKSWFRSGLVVFQFAISIVLIIGTIVITRQLSYIQAKDLGFQKEHVAFMPLFLLDRTMHDDERLTKQYQTIKQEFVKHPDITQASASRGLPGWVRKYTKVQAKDQNNAHQMYLLYVDEHFLDTFGVKILSGRNFSQNIPTDATEALIINETAAKQLGWSDPIGKELSFNQTQGRVVGVVRDFHSRSLHEATSPFVLSMNNNRGFFWLSLRIQATNMPETLAFIQSKWQQYIPGRALDITFLDDFIHTRYYTSESRLEKISSIASSIAIFLACLGILGLAAYAAERRTKEIGIRKVLGASTNSLLTLLSRDFIYLVVLANLIAWPIAYWMMNTWLQNFAFQTSLSPVIFALSGLVALCIALLTVGYQAFRVTSKNPVESLRHD